MRVDLTGGLVGEKYVASARFGIPMAGCVLFQIGSRTEGLLLAAVLPQDGAGQDHAADGLAVAKVSQRLAEFYVHLLDHRVHPIRPVQPNNGDRGLLDKLDGFVRHRLLVSSRGHPAGHRFRDTRRFRASKRSRNSA